MAMFLPACLVTSSPSPEEALRTPPFLLSPGAEPELRTVKVVEGIKGAPAVEFKALVWSEDDGVSVKGRLVLDYGSPPESGPPYPYGTILPPDVDIEPATLNDPPRTLAAKWFPYNNQTTPGCHTVTLLATHEFNQETGCPRDPTDFDFLTWTIIACDKTPCCDPTKPFDDGGCSLVDCPAIQEGKRCDLPQGGGT